MTLIIVKGPTCYEDINKIGVFPQDSCRGACFVIDLIAYGKEYIEAIKKAFFRIKLFFKNVICHYVINEHFD